MRNTFLTELRFSTVTFIIILSESGVKHFPKLQSQVAIAKSAAIQVKK
jgi:hypothetical protein